MCYTSCALFLISTLYALGFCNLQEKKTMPFAKGRQASYQKLVDNLLQKYPELEWLYKETHTQKSSSVLSNTQKKTSYQKKVFDQLMFSLEILSVVVHGSYEEYLELFVSQTEDKRLDWEHFLQIQELLKKTFVTSSKLSKQEWKEVLEFALILDKCVMLDAVLNKAWIYEVFPNKRGKYAFLNQILEKSPEIFLTHAKFTRKQREVLKDLMFFVHLKNASRMYSLKTIYQNIQKEKLLEKEQDNLEAILLLYNCCKVSEEGNPLTTLTDDRIKDFEAFRESVYWLKTHSVDACCEYYLTRKAEILHFSPYLPTHLALTKICALLDIHSPLQAAYVKNVLLQMSAEDVSNIFIELEDYKSCDYKSFIELIKHIQAHQDTTVDASSNLVKLIKHSFSIFAQAIKENKKQNGGQKKICFAVPKSSTFPLKDKVEVTLKEKENRMLAEAF